MIYWSASVASIAQTTGLPAPKSKPTGSLGSNVGKESTVRENHMGAFTEKTHGCVHILVLNSSNKWNATIITLLHFGHLMIYWSSSVALAQTTGLPAPNPQEA